MTVRSFSNIIKRLGIIHLLPSRPVSMRFILNISLFLFITVIMAFLTAVNYLQLVKQNEKLFNMQMIHTANIIDVLVSMNIQHVSLNALAELLNQKDNMHLTEGQIKSRITPKTQEFFNIYQKSFFFQVYSLKDQHMILKSSNAPDTPVKLIDGFGITSIAKTLNSTWYVFSTKSQYQPVRIVVAVNEGFKQQVVMDLFWNLLKGIVWLYIVSAALIMILVRVIFAPLVKIAVALKKRNPRDIAPLTMTNIPKEVVPLLNQINELFIKFNTILERERRFAGDAAHELKTPLAGIKTQLEVALNVDDIESIKEKMHTALKNIDRYYHIIDQLLTLTRLEPQAILQTRNETIELNRFAAEWIAEMVPEAMKKNIELSLNRSNKAVTILASRAAFDILFRNLLDNAIRYTPNDGQVTVSIEKENDQVLLRFSDTGIGVEADKLQRIFDRFYRQRGTGQQGSGLGLSIVKEIVRLHDGSVKAVLLPKGGLEVQIYLSIWHNPISTNDNE